MKIIAQCSGGYLVQTTRDEIANLMGYSNEYCLKDRDRQVAIGVEIKVSELWSLVEFERGRPGAITNAAKNLRALADKLDKVNLTIANPVVLQTDSNS